MLVFVYSADSGLFNALGDIAHRVFSPHTYPCNLCGLTYSIFGMRREWAQFLLSLDTPFEFLHRDELKERYGIEGEPLPAIFVNDGEKLSVWITASEIDSCKNLDNLKRMIMDRLSIPAD